MHHKLSQRTTNSLSGIVQRRTHQRGMASAEYLYSGLHISVWQHRTRKRSPAFYTALTPPSPFGRGGIGTRPLMSQSTQGGCTVGRGLQEGG
jgi:hypothetical protein